MPSVHDVAKKAQILYSVWRIFGWCTWRMFLSEIYVCMIWAGFCTWSAGWWMAGAKPPLPPPPPTGTPERGTGGPTPENLNLLKCHFLAPESGKAAQIFIQKQQRRWHLYFFLNYASVLSKSKLTAF
jgi:hypothetical protein